MPVRNTSNTTEWRLCECVCVSLASYRFSSWVFLLFHLKCSSWSQESTGFFLLESVCACVGVRVRECLCVRKKGQSKSQTPSDWVFAPARTGTVFLVPGSNTHIHPYTRTDTHLPHSNSVPHIPASLSSSSPDTSSFIHTDSKHTLSTESLFETHTWTRTHFK